MLLILDSNVYIFGFGLFKEPACGKLILTVAKKSSIYIVRISRTIVEEVHRHLSPEDFQRFIRFINSLTAIDEDILVPFELGAKYESKGFKPADAFIAAYVEWTGSNILVTENRHFLTRHSDLPFRVLTAEKCSKLIK